MTSGPIKLHYFNAADLGEPIRFLLHYGGIKFIDERLLSIEEFLNKKQTYPYGKVPVLEIEGKTIHQTKAICRYLAKKVGLVGKTDWDALECDIMVDTIDDLRNVVTPYLNSKDANAKEIIFSTTVDYYLSKFETHLGQNGGYFIKKQLTWADFFFAGIYEYFNYIAGKDIFTDRPALKALREKVISLKGVKEYMTARPPPSF